ncbi:ECF transporter S component [Clostridium fungisolvens]|uniref:Thiamine transporter HmpT n=1 Tax=Clostridium fungisolvens TaxID=1604897 RepID=A0A6V8SDC4_9CLOT|nr:ECF transporter S component [Clostridium fungisolvens]GFP74455.1 Thiamine precursor transporter HmpT [Clostridium fungisolvens]
MEVNGSKSKFKTKDLVITALLTALVFVATAFINVRLPFLSNGGLVHLGTVMLFITATVFGKEKGAIAGAVGMAIFDLSSGWALWAPFTFVVRGVMGYMVGSIAWSKNKSGDSFMLNSVAMILSGIWMIFGYYVTEGILYGNWITPVGSIPGNVAQIVLGLALGLPMAKVLKRYVKYI